MRRVLISEDSRQVESFQTPSRKRRRSPADERRRQLRLVARAQENASELASRRVERVEAWADGGRDEFLAFRQDAALDALGQERRELRAAVRREAAHGVMEDHAAAVLGIKASSLEGDEFTGRVMRRADR